MKFWFALSLSTLVLGSPLLGRSSADEAEQAAEASGPEAQYQTYAALHHALFTRNARLVDVIGYFAADLRRAEVRGAEVAPDEAVGLPQNQLREILAVLRARYDTDAARLNALNTQYQPLLAMTEEADRGLYPVDAEDGEAQFHGSKGGGGKLEGWLAGRAERKLAAKADSRFAGKSGSKLITKAEGARARKAAGGLAGKLDGKFVGRKLRIPR